MSGILAVIGAFLSPYKTLLIKIAVFAALAGVVYLYWNHLENKITTLTQENTILTDTVKTQNTTIDKLQQNFSATQKKLDGLNKKYSDLKNSTKNPVHDIDVGHVTDANKVDIEKKINDAFNTIFFGAASNTLPSSF